MNCPKVLAGRIERDSRVTLGKNMDEQGRTSLDEERTQMCPEKSISRTTFWWLVYTLIRVRTTDAESHRGERHVYREASADMLPLHGPRLLTSNSVATARCPAQIQILVERRESKDADNRGLLVG